MPLALCGTTVHRCTLAYHSFAVHVTHVLLEKCTHCKSLISIFIRGNQTRIISMHSSFDCVHVHLQGGISFDLLNLLGHFFSSDFHLFQKLLNERSFLSNAQQIAMNSIDISFIYLFGFFRYEIFQLKIVPNDRYLLVVNSNNTIFTSCFYWHFFLHWIKLKWEREE